MDIAAQIRAATEAGLDAARQAAPEPYVADPLNPTDAELSAAIQRGLDDGTLIDAADWLDRNRDLEPEAELELELEL